MLSVLALLLLLSQSGGEALPATDVSAAQIQATLKEAIEKKIIDIPIRTVDAGGHHVGIGTVQRPAGTNLPGGASHDKVTEVYYVIEGSGTLVTGGRLVSPERRESTARNVTQINGPGYSGKAIEGGVSRRIGKGDMVIIPAGTPHWFSEIQAPIRYVVVRVDPERVVVLK